MVPIERLEQITRRCEYLEAQMAVKDVFDAKWLLNPAKVFPLDVSETRRGARMAAE